MTDQEKAHELIERIKNYGGYWIDIERELVAIIKTAREDGYKNGMIYADAVEKCKENWGK